LQGEFLSKPLKEEQAARCFLHPYLEKKDTATKQSVYELCAFLQCLISRIWRSDACNDTYFQTHTLHMWVNELSDNFFSAWSLQIFHVGLRTEKRFIQNFSHIAASLNYLYCANFWLASVLHDLCWFNLPRSFMPHVGIVSCERCAMLHCCK
jgi:hypothetical protein